jgi:hypothetical protein
MSYQELFQGVCLEYDEKENSLVFQFGANTNFQVNPMRSMELNPSPYILPMKVIHINNFAYLTYEIGNQIKLSQFLKERILRQDFLKLLLQISQVILDADNYYANENNFVLDENYIYVNAQHFTPSLMYFPVEFEGNIKRMYQEFMERILKEERFLEEKERKTFRALLTKASFRIQDAHQWIYFLLHGEEEKMDAGMFQKDENHGKLVEQDPKELHFERSTSNISNPQSKRKDKPVEEEPRNSLPEKGPQIPKIIPGSKGFEKGKQPDKKKAKGNPKAEKKKDAFDWGNVLTNFFKEKLHHKKKEGKDLNEPAPFGQEKNELVKPIEKPAPPIFRGDLESTQLLVVEPLHLGWLMKKGEEGSGKFEIKSKLYKIGRDPEENDLVLEDMKVSKKHATIHQENEGFFITDKGSMGEGSTNGVYLNGERIEKVKPTKINDQDEIRIAKTTFIFYIKE